MRLCNKHFEMCRRAVSERGLLKFTADDAEPAVFTAEEILGPPPAAFDSLRLLQRHFFSVAAQRVPASIDLAGGDKRCPVCSLAKDWPTYETGRVADHYVEHARLTGLMK